MNVFRSIVFLLTALALGPGAVAQVPVRTAVLDFDTTAPNLVEQDSNASLTLQGYGRVWRLELQPNRGLLDGLSAAARERVKASGNRFYVGRVAGESGSWARVNHIAGRLTAMFFNGRALYLVERADAFELPAGRRAEAGTVIMFRYADLAPDLVDHGGVIPIGYSAGPGARTGRFEDFIGHMREIVRLSGEAEFAIPVTIVSDTQFSGTHGDDAAAVVAGRMNFIDGIYSSQLGTGIVLLHHEILEDNGALTSTDPSVLLSDQFGPFMRDGAGSSIPFGGLAHLFTGRDLDGNVVGIAYLGSLCSSFAGYGVNQNRSSDTASALIVAHELGHNFGAGHDDNPDACPAGTLAGIMNSRISESQQFSECSLDAMSARVADASCLVEVTRTEEIFANGFEP